MAKWVIALVLLVAAASADRVLRIVPQDDQQVASLRKVLDEMPWLDIWLEPRKAGLPVDVLLDDEHEPTFKSIMENHHLKTEVFIEDVQKMIRDQNRDSFRRGNLKGWSNWTDYERLDAIYEWMESIEQQYSGIASVVDVGDTYEKRRIKGLKLNLSGNSSNDAPIVFVEAGIHAREWITCATATYLINQLLTNKTPQFANTVNQYDWVIFPSVNPDGYEYTHTKNRLWRKTMSKHYFIFTGVDANRNWPYKWNTAGSSSIPAMDTYAGPKAESEIETQNLRAYLDKVANRTRVYISLHAYSQLLMFPWGYTSQHSDTHEELNSIASKTVQYIRNNHNTTYRFGNIADAIYPASGNTIDYAYSKGIPYPFVFEQRDTGKHGFLLPKEQIVAAAKEIVEAVWVILGEVKK